MAAKTVITGISISHNIASLAVLEHRPDEVELLFLGEHERADPGEFWYLTPLDHFLETSRTKINQIAVAIDASHLTIVQCPLDIALNQTERNDHVNWELSKYIKNYRPKDYISDLYVLDIQDQIQRVLAVTVRRNLIFGLQELLGKRGLILGVVDVNHFATDNSIRRTYPEVERTDCVLVGFGHSRIDASILRNGHMIGYRYSLPTSDDEISTFLRSLLDDRSPSGMYLYGTHLSKDQEKLVKSLVSCPVTVVNPFRRLLISPAFGSFTRYAPYVHHFAAAVGVALRTA